MGKKIKKEIEKALRKHFKYTDFSGNIGGFVWVKRNTSYDYGNVENDFKDFINDITKLIHKTNKEGL